MTMTKLDLPPCEADLSGDDHDRFGAAMCKCSSGDPQGCAIAGMCLFGDCFTPVLLTEAEQSKEIDRLKKQNNELLVKQTLFLTRAEIIRDYFERKYQATKMKGDYQMGMQFSFVTRELTKLIKALEQTA